MDYRDSSHGSDAGIRGIFTPWQRSDAGQSGFGSDRQYDNDGIGSCAVVVYGTSMDSRICQSHSHSDNGAIEPAHRGVGDPGYFDGVELAMVSRMDGIDSSYGGDVGNNVVNGIDESL